MFRWLAGFALLALPIITLAGGAGRTATHAFSDPVDAVSVGMPGDAIDLEVSGFDGASRTWTPWQRLEIEKEFDPLLRESNLVMFPGPVNAVRVRGTTLDYDLHPIRVRRGPSRVMVASHRGSSSFHITSREEWGADPSLLVSGDQTTRSDTAGDNGSANGNGAAQEDPAHAPITGESSSASSSPRIRDCEEAQTNHPEDFAVARKVTTAPDGKILRWPQEYSPEVKLLVVHHTAIAVGGDARAGAERMRALYQYHASNRGWGDVGYNFVVGENGEIYEGRAGGDYVVAGHAYCNNRKTVGVALMVDANKEEPTQAQMRSLQTLLDELARKYGIDLERSARYHGKQFASPVVGHRELVSTDCPGFYVWGTMDQIRSNVERGALTAAIDFPSPPAPRSPPAAKERTRVDRAEERRTRRESLLSLREGLHAIGGVEIAGRPGEETLVSVRYQAGSRAHQRRSGIGVIRRGDAGIGVWMDKSGGFERLRNELFLPQFVKAGEELRLRLKIRFPREAGTATLQIGDLLYTLTTSGRRVRAAAPANGSFQTAERRPTQPQPAPPPSPPPASLPRTRPRSSFPQPSRPSVVATHRIRIRLSVPAAGDIVLDTDGNTQVGGMIAWTKTVALRRDASACVALAEDGREIARGEILHSDPGDAMLTIVSWRTPRNRFRGILECRIIGGELVLINELPLEQYLAGLAEEPDGEPFEKQRAFAIAARSYALHYLDPRNRKFKDMPYDGSDSPATFQAYGGAAFEESNPQWVRAVRDTAGLVLTADSDVLKTPYFSSDDGRTRSPDEAGWRDFPHSEIFASKPDPWCEGLPLAGHGVGMSGCGAEAQANKGKVAEEILEYYYPGATIERK